MKISTKGRYAVRLMLDVAIHGMDKNVSMRDVAERQNISIKYLEQIVSIRYKNSRCPCRQSELRKNNSF